jgi:hypothetical protein
MDNDLKPEWQHAIIHGLANAPSGSNIKKMPIIAAVVVVMMMVMVMVMVMVMMTKMRMMIMMMVC